MWIEKLSDGRYKYVERFRNPKTDKLQRVSLILASNSPQAKKKAQQDLNAKIRAKIRTPQNDIKITFGEMYELYYTHKSQSWSNASRQCASAYYRHHIKTEDLNNYLMNKITLIDVQSVIDHVQYDKNLSRIYALKIKSLIRSVFRHAHKYYDIPFSVDFSQVEVKSDRKSKNKIMYIDSSILKDEIDKIRQALPEVQADLIEVQILTGMRFGEVAALTKEDWKDGRITINKAIETSNKRTVSAPKNNQSNRIIESTQRVDEIIARRIRLNDLIFGDQASLIFANSHNRPQLRYYINQLLKQVNLDYTTHTMRHTHISLLAEKGLPIKYIMDRVGHTRPETTLRIYSHVSSQMRENAKKVLDDLV